MASNGIERLAVTRLSSAVAYGSSGTTAFTSTDYYLVSVIATNTTATDAEIYIYVLPLGATTETGYGLIAHKLIVPAYNSYETFRFGVNPTDVVKVAGPAGMAFYVQGIDQTA
jgi:hypothetical protein